MVYVYTRDAMHDPMNTINHGFSITAMYCTCQIVSMPNIALNLIFKASSQHYYYKGSELILMKTKDIRSFEFISF